MKNKIIALIVMCLIFANCIPAFASTDVNSNTIIGSETFEEIREREDYIVEQINSTLISENMKTIEKDDIDYNQIIKVYADMFKILSSDELNNEKMQEYTKDAYYSYVLPIYDKGKTVMVYMTEMDELPDNAEEIFTNEKIEEYKATIGKLIISVIRVYDGEVNFKKELETSLAKNNIENSYVYFVGAITNSFDTHAVICTDNPDDTRFKILERKIAPSIVEENESDKEYQNEGKAIYLDKDVLHTFDEIKIAAHEFISQEDNPTDEIMLAGAETSNSVLPNETPNNNILIVSIIFGVTVIVIAVAVICVIRKKKAKNIES